MKHHWRQSLPFPEIFPPLYHLQFQFQQLSTVKQFDINSKIFYFYMLHQFLLTFLSSWALSFSSLTFLFKRRQLFVSVRIFLIILGHFTQSLRRLELEMVDGVCLSSSVACNMGEERFSFSGMTCEVDGDEMSRSSRVDSTICFLACGP